MTEFETLLAAAEYYENALFSVSMFVTIVSGYLILAYTAGRDLSAFQTAFFNTVFVTFALLGMWSTYVFMDFGAGIAGNSEFISQLGFRPFGLTPGPFIVGLELIAVGGSLYFMHNVRSQAPKAEGRESEPQAQQSQS